MWMGESVCYNLNLEADEKASKLKAQSYKTAKQSVFGSLGSPPGDPNFSSDALPLVCSRQNPGASTELLSAPLLLFSCNAPETLGERLRAQRAYFRYTASHLLPYRP